MTSTETKITFETLPKAVEEIKVELARTRKSEQNKLAFLLSTKSTIR